MVAVAMPAPVALAAGLTAAGRAWMQELPAALETLERRWGVVVGQPLAGGTASYVAAARTSGGHDVVVKVALPPGVEGQGGFDAELSTLLCGGDGYVRVLEHDRAARAMLMERLGEPLARTGLPLPDQLTVIADTLRRAWAPSATTDALPHLRDKGLWLADFIGRTWQQTGRPCSQRAVHVAQQVARHRASAVDVSPTCVLHGDAHSLNVLQAADGDFRLVDPDGVVGEIEYDLAIPIREVPAEELAADPVGRAKALCVAIADIVEADPDIVWQWALVERMSTGLLCQRIGHRQWAAGLLAVVEEWASDF